jgi:hypothetical protein
MASTFPLLALASPVASPPWAERAAADGVFGLGLALAPPALAVGSVDLDHAHVVGEEVPGEPRAIAAGSFDAHQLEVPEGLEPAEQNPIAPGCGLEALDAKQRSSLVEGGGHMDVEVCVDPAGDASRDSGHRHPFVRLGDTAPAERRTGQRRACAAGSYEVTPSDRPVSGECPSRADESTSGQSERTSAGFDGVSPGSGTHPTLTRSPS